MWSHRYATAVKNSKNFSSDRKTLPWAKAMNSLRAQMENGLEGTGEDVGRGGVQKRDMTKLSRNTRKKVACYAYRC